MRKLFGTIALIGLSLPATAAETDCYSAAITWPNTATANFVDRDDNDAAAIVGTFLWIGQDFSVEIPTDAVGYSRCGFDVTFEVADEPVEKAPVVQVVDVSAEDWESLVDVAALAKRDCSAGVFPF